MTPEITVSSVAGNHKKNVHASGPHKAIQAVTMGHTLTQEQIHCDSGPHIDTRTDTL